MPPRPSLLPRPVPVAVPANFIRIIEREPRDGFELVNPDNLRQLSIRNKLERSIREIVGDDDELPACFILHELDTYEPHWFNASPCSPYDSKLDPILQPLRCQSPLVGGRFLYKEEARCPEPISWLGPQAFGDRREADVRAKRGETLKPSYNYAEILDELDLDPEVFVEVPIYVWGEYDSPSTPLPTFQVIPPQPFDSSDDNGKTRPLYDVSEEWQPPSSPPGMDGYKIITSEPVEGCAEQSTAEVPGAIAVTTSTKITSNRPATALRHRTASLPPSVRNGVSEQSSPKTNNEQPSGSNIPVAKPKGHVSRSRYRGPAEKTVSDGDLSAKMLITRNRSPSKIPVAERKAAQHLHISAGNAKEIEEEKARNKTCHKVSEPLEACAKQSTPEFPGAIAVPTSTKIISNRPTTALRHRTASLPPSVRNGVSEQSSAKTNNEQPSGSNIPVAKPKGHVSRSRYRGPAEKTVSDGDLSAKKLITRNRSPSKIPVAERKAAQHLHISAGNAKEIEEEKARNKTCHKVSEPLEACAKQSTPEFPGAIAVPTSTKIISNRPTTALRHRTASLPPSVRNSVSEQSSAKTNNEQPNGSNIPVAKPKGHVSRSRYRGPAEKTVSDGDLSAKKLITRNRSPSKIPVAERKAAQYLHISAGNAKEIEEEKARNQTCHKVSEPLEACAKQSTPEFPGAIAVPTSTKIISNRPTTALRHRTASLPPSVRNGVSEQSSAKINNEQPSGSNIPVAKPKGHVSRSRYPGPAEKPVSDGDFSAKMLITRDRSPSKIPVAVSTGQAKKIEEEKAISKTCNSGIPVLKNRDRSTSVSQTKMTTNAMISESSASSAPGNACLRKASTKPTGCGRKSRSRSLSKDPAAERVQAQSRKARRDGIEQLPTNKGPSRMKKSLTRERSPSKIPVMAKKSSVQQPNPESVTWEFEMGNAASTTKDDGTPQGLLQEEAHYPSAVASLPNVSEDSMTKKSPKASIPSSSKRSPSIPTLPDISGGVENENNNAYNQMRNIRAKMLRELTPYRKKERDLPPLEEVPNSMNPDCMGSFNTKLPRPSKRVTAPGLYPRRTHSLPPMEVSKRNACLAEDGTKNATFAQTKPKIPTMKATGKNSSVQQPIARGISWEIKMDSATSEDKSSGFPVLKEEAPCPSTPHSMKKSLTRHRSPSRIPVRVKKASVKKSLTKKRSPSKIPVRVKKASVQKPIPKSIAWEIDMDTGTIKKYTAPKSFRKKNGVKCRTEFVLKTYKPYTAKEVVPVKCQKEVPTEPKVKPRRLYEPFAPTFIQKFYADYPEQIEKRKKVYPELKFEKDDWLPLIFIEPGDDEEEEKFPLIDLKEWEDIKKPFTWIMPQNLDAAAQKEVATPSILPSTEMSFADACAETGTQSTSPAATNVATPTVFAQMKNGTCTKVPHPQAIPAKKGKLCIASSSLHVPKARIKSRTRGARIKPPVARIAKPWNISIDIFPPVSLKSESSAVLSSKIPTPEAIAASRRALSPKPSKIPTALPIPDAEDRKHVMTPFSLPRIEVPKRQLQRRVMSPSMG